MLVCEGFPKRNCRPTGQCRPRFRDPVRMHYVREEIMSLAMGSQRLRLRPEVDSTRWRQRREANAWSLTFNREPDLDLTLARRRGCQKVSPIPEACQRLRSAALLEFVSRSIGRLISSATAALRRRLL